MGRAQQRALAKVHRSWEREGWLPIAISVPLLLLAIWATEIRSPEEAATNLAANDFLTVLRDIGVSLWRALAEAGVTAAPSAPWVLQCFIGLVVAFIALPTIRDIAGRTNVTGMVERVARSALDTAGPGMRGRCARVSQEQRLTSCCAGSVACLLNSSRSSP